METFKIVQKNQEMGLEEKQVLALCTLVDLKVENDMERILQRIDAIQERNELSINALRDGIASVKESVVSLKTTVRWLITTFIAVVAVIVAAITTLVPLLAKLVS